MTDSPPFKLLSPLGPELTKFLQKRGQPSAAEEKVKEQKKWWIVNVMQAIERTPPSASAAKTVTASGAEAKAKAAVKAKDVGEIEASVSDIDRLILDVIKEVTAEGDIATVPDKEREIDTDPLGGEDFDLQHLGGQELSEEEKMELKEFAISCGYQPWSLLFGGVVEEILGCIRDRAGAKIVGTLSKSVGFPKLETDISCYRRQHIVGSLFYSNFKVRPLTKLLLLSLWWIKCSDYNLLLQSMLLSKALKMKQDNEDRKNEIIIEGLENKIKDLEASLKKKDFLLQAVKGSLAEAQSQNTKLSEELDNARTILNKKSERFDQEIKELQSRAEAEAEKNTKLRESMKDLRNKCTNFVTHCVNWLKGIFNSFGATSEEIAPLAEDIPKAFEHIENEVEALDEVIIGHKDFCALLASRGIAAAFLKAGCTHAKTVNKPTFNLSTSDFVDIPANAQSIGNRFITQIWAKGGRELAGDEARKLLESVWSFYLYLFTLVYLY
jgi:hypothetical protein